MEGGHLVKNFDYKT